MIATITNRIRSALGHSSSPPARIGRIISPGENQEVDTFTAAIPSPTTVSARTKPSLRFLVMNWRRIRPRKESAADCTADQDQRPELETMMAKLYRYIRIAHPPDHGDLRFSSGAAATGDHALIQSPNGAVLGYEGDHGYISDPPDQRS